MKDHPESTNEESPYYSVDPTPAMPASTPTDELRALLLDESQSMFTVGREHRSPYKLIGVREQGGGYRCQQWGAAHML